MKRTVVLITFVLCSFFDVNYGQHNFLTDFNFKSNNEDFANKPNVKVVIEDVRSKKGILVIAIFKDQESFKNRKPLKKIVLNKSNIKGNEVVFNLEIGVYGISVLDDENENSIMDYNFFGIPKEGFGFSNYYHKGLTKPHLDDFKFEIAEGIIKNIEIRLRYI